MKNIIIIIIFGMLSMSEGNCAEKIGGIMGLSLGRKFYPPSTNSGCKLLEKRNDRNERCVVYVYQLPKDRGNLKMDIVTVEVTPKTGIICEISARTRTNEFPTLDEAKATLSLIISRLEEKHGKSVGNCIDRGNQRVCWLTFEDHGTVVNAKGEKENVVTGAMIVVNCFDMELSDRAAQEREEINGESYIFEYF